jgi:hypothetical protein
MLSALNGDCIYGSVSIKPRWKKIKFLFIEITLEGLPDILFQGEHALPQQFIHVFKDGHFETTPVSHSGG